MLKKPFKKINVIIINSSTIDSISQGYSPMRSLLLLPRGSELHYKKLRFLSQMLLPRSSSHWTSPLVAAGKRKRRAIAQSLPSLNATTTHVVAPIATAPFLVHRQSSGSYRCHGERQSTIQQRRLVIRIIRLKRNMNV